MICHLVLFQVKPEVDEERIEWMMRQTRIQLLKIPEVLNLRCGKRIEEDSEWPFFLAIEVESLDKLKFYAEDPIHIKYVQDVIKPYTTKRLAVDYEMEPGKNIRYS